MRSLESEQPYLGSFLGRFCKGIGLAYLGSFLIMVAFYVGTCLYRELAYIGSLHGR